MSFSIDSINNIENLIAKNRVKGFSFYFFFVCVLLIFLGLLPFIKIQISTQSRGVVKSEFLPVPIQSIVSGKIVNINLQNNLAVSKDDTLFVIAQEKLLTEKKISELLSSDMQKLANDLRFVLVNKSCELKTLLVKQEWQGYQSKITELRTKIKQREISYERNNLLYQKGVISKAEFESFSFDLESSQNELNSLIQAQKAQWQNRLQELSEKQNNINLSIEQINTDKTNYIITAPISGVIENFNGLYSGAFVIANQPIALISPQNNLIIENLVSSNDIGLVYIGQHVNLQIDAFNYNQWGLAKGKVEDIDKNVTIIENQPFFKVRCSIENTQMKLKNGYVADVKNGMTLTARFIVAKRSVFDLLFDKVDDWLNPKLIK